jgi:hypothetical protein
MNSEGMKTLDFVVEFIASIIGVGAVIFFMNILLMRQVEKATKRILNTFLIIIGSFLPIFVILIYI